jgi:hypothetical protein
LPNGNGKRQPETAIEAAKRKVRGEGSLVLALTHYLLPITSYPDQYCVAKRQREAGKKITPPGSIATRGAVNREKPNFPNSTRHLRLAGNIGDLTPPNCNQKRFIFTVIPINTGQMQGLIAQQTDLIDSFGLDSLR